MLWMTIPWGVLLLKIESRMGGMSLCQKNGPGRLCVDGEEGMDDLEANGARPVVGNNHTSSWMTLL
jgi:hypothetical protein